MSTNENSPTEDVGSFLPSDAYAVTYHPKRGFNIHLPHAVAEQDGEVPDTATALLACATRLANDSAFLLEQVRWMEEQSG